MLNLHLSLVLPESESAEFQKEVQQVVAAGWLSEMNVRYSLTRSGSFFSSAATSLFSQPMAVVQLTVMRGS